MLFIVFRLNSVERNFVGIQKLLYGAIILYFIIVPICFVLFLDEIKNNVYYFWVQATEISAVNIYTATLIFVLGVGALSLGFNLSCRIGVQTNFSSSWNPLYVKAFIISLCFFSIFVNVIHIYNLGGLFNAIVNAEFYRSHGSYESPLGQLTKVQPFIVIGTLLLFPFKTKLRFLFLLCSIIYLLIESSRTNLGFFLIAFYLYHKNINSDFKIKNIIFPFLIAVFMAYFGNSVTDYIYTGEFNINSSFIYSSIGQFSPASSNLLNMAQFVGIEGYRYFYDILSFLPKDMGGLGSNEKTWQSLTSYYLGGFWSVGMQIDLFSYGFSQLSYFGTVVYSFIFGIIVGRVKQLTKAMQSAAKKLGDPIFYRFAVMYEIVAAIFFISILNWGSLDATVISGTMKYWFFIVLLPIVMRIKN